MNIRKILTVVIGFGTVGLLSSAFAKIQGALNPISLTLFTGTDMVSEPIVTLQLVIKLLCVYISCFIAGIVTTMAGGRLRENLMVGALTVLVVVWLWLSVLNPFWFWILLILGVLPCVLLGSKWFVGLKVRH